MIGSMISLVRMRPPNADASAQPQPVHTMTGTVSSEHLMWLDREFMESVGELYVPTMGTAVLAPTLYSLLRLIRARSVLEAGMGYTTPFIARALHDNEACFRAERAALREKAEPYVRELDTMGDADRTQRGPEGRGLQAIYAPKASALADRRTEWMFSDPAALLRPGYYLEERPSRLFCVDNIESNASSARHVKSKLVELGLDGHVEELVGDFWSYDFSATAKDYLPFDVIWLDLPVSVRHVMSLLDGPHWKLLNPNGGLLIIHDMLTHEGGQMLVNEFFKSDQQNRFKDFELIGLLEPQRTVQNSVVVIRKLTGYREQKLEALYTAPGESAIEREARALLASE
jgi:predicted O-methyltransferase YrrM